MRSIILNKNQYISRYKILSLSHKHKLGHIPSAFSMTDYFSVFINNFYNKDNMRFFIGKNYGSVVYFINLLNIEDPEISRLITSVITIKELFLFRDQIIYTDDTLCNALGVAAGYAFDNRDKIIIVNMGDAALYNGLTYESLIFISKFKLNNIVLFVDRNRRGVTTSFNNDSSNNIEKVIFDLGWDVIYCNGHDIDNIYTIFKLNFNYNDMKLLDRPKCFIFNTIKGYGIYDFMTDYNWHGKIMTNTDYTRYVAELCENYYGN